MSTDGFSIEIQYCFEPADCSDAREQVRLVGSDRAEEQFGNDAMLLTIEVMAGMNLRQLIPAGAPATLIPSTHSPMHS